MRLYISVDMEGVSGVTAWEHVLPGNHDYQYYRHVMTADVNAAILGASEAGVNEFFVRDGHASAMNLLIHELDERVSISLGMPALNSMVQNIEDGFDAAFFIGYHARMGTAQAVLDHTWSSKHISNIFINERPVGEIGLNALMCAHYQIPVILLSGDVAACTEAQQWIEGIETVAVKQANGRSAAHCLSPKEAQNKIYKSAKRCVEKLAKGIAVKIPEINFPAPVIIEFNNTRMADFANMLKDTKRLDGKTIQITAENMPDAYRNITVLSRLAGSD